MKLRDLHLSMFCFMAMLISLFFFELAGAADNSIIEMLDKNIPYTVVSPDLFGKLGEDLKLPDGGKHVKELADKAPGGAFDPRDLEKISSKALGYKAKWSVIRYKYYGLDWDITGLRLESLDPKAKKLPWLVIMNGGSANFYEFFLDPFNRTGLGQYLAQKINVLLVTIPGNFKYGGWELPPSQRPAQYLLDQDLSPEENKVRNAIYTNRMEVEGLKRLILKETSGDILLIGHSTSGELAFLSMGEKELAERLKGRFLGWGSGTPSNLRKEWEEEVGRREKRIQELSNYPPLWDLRTRDAKGYVGSKYIGPLNPCGKPGMTELEVAERWISIEGRRRPQFKQVMQDMEHGGMVELQSKVETQIREALSATKLPVKLEDVSRDMFATNNAPLKGYNKMLWVVAQLDYGHWNKENPQKALELTVANQFRKRNPEAAIRILLFDLPMTHYGHIEMPRQVAGGLIAAMQWVLK